jgi:5'-nucleotidase
MSKKPKILIVNDDGIYAPGLKQLWNSLVDKSDLAIVAPAFEKSGAGLSLTLRKPLVIEPVSWEKETPAWKVAGTPADCVRLAISILNYKPDLIVSGINRGSNSGRNVLYSGTVGGIIEGALRSIPGIAFSCEEFEKPDYEATAEYIYPFVQHILEHPLPNGTFLNVTFPTSKTIEGVKMARQGMGYWRESPQQRLHPEGHYYYWMGGTWHHHEEHEESDVALLKKGYVTAVPIHINEMTDQKVFESRKNHLENLFVK